MSWPGSITCSEPRLSRCRTSTVGQPGDRLQPDVRVRADVEPAVLGDVGGTHVVGEAPGADGAPPSPGERASYGEPTDLGLVAVADLHARVARVAPLGRVGRSVCLGDRTTHPAIMRPVRRGRSRCPLACCDRSGGRRCAEGQTGKRPARTPLVTTEGGVDGERAGSGVDQRDERGDQHGVVLPAALRRPDALRLVDLADRGDHRADQARGGQRRGCPGDQQCSPRRLGDARCEGVGADGTHVQGAHHLLGALQAGAVEPAEQLLRAVADEEGADDGAGSESSELHAPTPTRGAVAQPHPTPGDLGHSSVRCRSSGS